MPRLRGVIRGILIKLLFKLLDTADVKSSGHSEKWLAECYQNKGFRDYIFGRDFMIIRHLAGGDQLTAPEHRKVWQMTGQRVELLKLGQMAKQAFEKRERNIKKKAVEASREASR